ncbi:MAG: 50S ribosomal protein L24 [Methanomethylophilus sp.]|jgi:large subunit ribosomal protein L24
MVSSKARVQRKAQYNAPAHTKRKMLSAHLSDELSEKYGRRTARVCEGDTVAIVRGDEDVKGVEGKVVSVDTKTGRVTVDGVTIKQADGTAVARPVHASNVVIVKLNLQDPLRSERLGSKEAAE